MSNRDALEHELQRAWSFDELEVYGDHLLDAGDPRGELISLDRQPLPADQRWRTRRAAALDRWLGRELALRAGHLTMHGFVHELRVGMHPPEWLDGPFGAVVRGYTTWGNADRITIALERLVARRRPWLSRLVIANWSGRPCAPELANRLIGALPNLRELHLIGAPAFREFLHPALRTIVHTASVQPKVMPAVERKHRSSLPYATDWPLTVATREQLLGTLADLDDLNQLYAWWQDSFDEPLAALVVRLAAAGEVTLGGPLVWRSGNYPVIDENYAGNVALQLTSHGEVALTIPAASTHHDHLRRECERTQLTKPLREAVERYLSALQYVSFIGGWEREPRERSLSGSLPELAQALDTMTERYALDGTQPRAAGWDLHDALATMLARPNGQRRLHVRRR